MSHEIRTPLNGIIGFTDLLLEELDDEHQEYLSLIKKSGTMLLNIINDILDFSKIENNQIELEEIDFNLQDCIENILDLQSQKAGAKDVNLFYNIESDVKIGMRGDMGRIQQILMNLISNAIKFTEQGAVEVYVKTVPDNAIEIWVKDTGVGFDEKMSEKLFRPFLQEDASTTRRYGGTGLGLSICKQLVELMGGSIRAESQKGEGSSFIVKLPFIPAEKMISRVSDELDLSWMKGVNILVVDDHQSYLKYMQVRLGRWQMNPLVVDSPMEALRIIENNKDNFDVILIDRMMPGMNGIELAKELKRRYGDRCPPMVMVTSARLSGEKAEILKSGFASILYKPIHEREFALELHKVIQQRHETPSPEELEKAGDDEEGGGSYALLVEDNPINAKLAKIILQRMGFPVHVAHNGKEALEALDRNRRLYNIILMDMQMPEMDGLEATRRIRSGEGGEYYRDISIVAMTANATQDDEKACMKAGMDRFLTKPMKSDDLKREFVELEVLCADKS